MGVHGDNWTIGTVLTEDEVDLLESRSALDEVLAITTHPTPGGHFSDPYEGTYLQRDAAGQVFSSVPDASDPESTPNEVTFLGTVESDEDLIKIATAFITGDDHEVAAAIRFHFKEESFGAEDWFWQALPEFYWFRLGTKHGALSKSLDQAMKDLSPLYKYIARFFDSPDDVEFQEFRDVVSRESSFEVAFSRFKYNSEIQ